MPARRLPCVVPMRCGGSSVFLGVAADAAAAIPAILAATPVPSILRREKLMVWVLRSDVGWSPPTRWGGRLPGARQSGVPSGLLKRAGIRRTSMAGAASTIAQKMPKQLMGRLHETRATFDFCLCRFGAPTRRMPCRRARRLVGSTRTCGPPSLAWNIALILRSRTIGNGAQKELRPHQAVRNPSDVLARVNTDAYTFGCS